METKEDNFLKDNKEKNNKQNIKQKDKDKTIADLHIHSRFSRACSKNIDFPNLVKYAKIKGLDLLGTGDFTHPVWISEIKKLREENGLYYLGDFPFIISGEISLIYTQNNKGRRIHLVVLVPNLQIAEKINSYFDTKGRRDYDGRPIFKITCEKFTEDLKKISEDIEIIPAHIWTPWFGMFGSKSGFDSLKEAFGEQIKYINAIETGLSSDPEMNWKISELNNKAIVSFSDAHSFWPWRIGREATIFNGKIKSYNGLITQIRENSIFGTIEVDPAYGKYHWDGHRNCDFYCSPAKSKEIDNICPKCNNLLTIGVENRVEEIANQEINKNPSQKNFYKLLPLHELISLVKASSLSSQKIWQTYNDFINIFENEFNVLLNISREEMLKHNFDEKLVDLIIKNRNGQIRVKPGYDGVYGEAQLSEMQKKLF